MFYDKFIFRETVGSRNVSAGVTHNYANAHA